MECPVQGCTEWIETKRSLLEHRRHDHNGSGTLICKLCPVNSRLSTIQKLEQHCAKYHVGTLLSGVARAAPPRPPIPQAESREEDEFSPAADFDVDLEEDNNHGSADFGAEIRRFFAQQMGRGVARSTLDSVSTLIDHALRIGESCDSTLIAEAHAANSSCSTHYKRTQSLCQSGDVLAPQKCQMGVIQTTKRDCNGEARRVEQGENFYVLPLADVLRQAVEFLNCHGLINSCNSPHICCHQRGERLKTISAASQVPNATVLPFLLYCDDVAPGSSLGPKASANSLCIMQIKLAGLHLEVSSSLSSKFVYAVCYAKDHSAHSFLPLLDVLKQQLAAIHNSGGIQIGNKVFLPTLLSVVADNKAQYELRGLKLNYSRCRLCLVESGQFLTATRESQALLKDRAWYDGVCRSGLAQRYGFKEGCPLAGIPCYDVMNDCALDLMHDVLEGEAHRATIRLLRALDRRGLKLGKVNAILSNFPYGKQDSSSRPSPFKIDVLSGASISQRASQVHTLLRVLPLALHGHVDVSDCLEWKSYLILGKLVLTLLLPAFSVDDLTSLEDLIAMYIDSVREIVTKSPDMISMTIKAHHLVHYPMFIRLFGPPVLNWCMDFEQLNASIKSHSYLSRNSQNLPFTMIHHAQLFLASQRALFSLDAVPSGGLRDVSDLPADSPLISVLNDLSIPAEQLCYRVEYRGMSYGESDVVVLSGGSLPTFAKVSFMVCCSGVWQMIVQQCDTQSWNDRVNCFSVQMSEVLFAVAFEDLNSAHPLDSYFCVSDNVVYVPLRHFPLK